MFDDVGEVWTKWFVQETLKHRSWEEIVFDFYYCTWNSTALEHDYPFLHEPLMTTMSAVNTAGGDGEDLDKWAEIESLEPMKSLTVAYLAKYPPVRSAPPPPRSYRKRQALRTAARKPTEPTQR